MTDARLTMVAGDLDDPVGAIDLDDVSDIESLLIILFSRPISVEERQWVDEDGGSREVTAVDLVRVCASVVAEFGSSGGDCVDPSDGQNRTLAMGDSDLLITLQSALGKVRLFNILHADE